MSNVAAAIGLGQLDMLSGFVDRLREIFDWYEETLSSLPGIEFMPEAAYGKANRWLTVMLVDEDTFGAAPEDIRIALEAETSNPGLYGNPCTCSRYSRTLTTPAAKCARTCSGAASACPQVQP